MSKRRNRIGGQFSARLVEMLESPAYRVLSVSAHRVISRIEIEHASHGGSENGNLPVTKRDFMDYGLNHDSVAPAIREAEALGFIRMKRGRGGNAEHRVPNRFFLTFAHGRGNSHPPTDAWRKIKTMEEALAVAQFARAAKDPRAVHFAQKRRNKNKLPVRKTRTETGPKNQDRKLHFTGPKNQDHGGGGKPGPLSIYRDGGWGVAADRLEPKAKAKGACEPKSDAKVDDGRHTRESLLTYVANVIEEQLNQLDASHKRARLRAQARAQEHCPFDPVRTVGDDLGGTGCSP